MLGETVRSQGPCAATVPESFLPQQAKSATRKSRCSRQVILVHGTLEVSIRTGVGRRILKWAEYETIRVEVGMTVGTSPQPLGAASVADAEAEICADACWARVLGVLRRGRFRLLPAMDRRAGGAMRGAAMLGIGILSIVSMTASSGALPAEGMLSGLVSGFGQFNAAFFMLAGAGMAFLTLHTVKSRQETSSAPQPGQLSGLGDLLAQMSHELRTPLNAVIGFSDVMRQELYGPIGNARYQEYVHHIAESGGRMLKSSQDALATAETMAALLSRPARPVVERLTAGSVVREALTGSGLAPDRVQILGCTACEIVCERRATAQAIGHLLREAAICTGVDEPVEVRGRRQGAKRILAISAGAAGGAAPTVQNATSLGPLLARLLIEAQGAQLSIVHGPGKVWTATISFRNV